MTTRGKCACGCQGQPRRSWGGAERERLRLRARSRMSRRTQPDHNELALCGTAEELGVCPLFGLASRTQGSAGCRRIAERSRRPLAMTSLRRLRSRRSTLVATSHRRRGMFADTSGGSFERDLFPRSRLIFFLTPFSHNPHGPNAAGARAGGP